MKATLVERFHVACPHCGEEDGRVDHLFRGTPKSFGPWYCKSCRRGYVGRVLAPKDVEVTPIDRSMPETLDLLMLPPQDKPVYFVVKGLAVNGEMDGKAYYYEEHSCPTNYIRCEAIISDDDDDPHGLFKFVRAMPMPGHWDEDGNNSFRDLFPEVEPTP